jgi:hypothetical protein
MDEAGCYYCSATKGAAVRAPDKPGTTVPQGCRDILMDRMIRRALLARATVLDLENRRAEKKSWLRGLCRGPSDCAVAAPGKGARPIDHRFRRRLDEERA